MSFAYFPNQTNPIQRLKVALHFFSHQLLGNFLLEQY